MPASKIEGMIIAACLCVALALTLCAGHNAVAATIDTFPFDAPLRHGDSISSLVVGPDGGIWFCLEKPLRLMQICEDEMQCVHDSGVDMYIAPDVSFAPDGTLYLDNFQYTYSDEGGISATEIQQPDYGWTHINLICPGIFDADMRMYCLGEPFDIYEVDPFDVWELIPGASPVIRYPESWLFNPIVVSITECWGLYGYNFHGTIYSHLDLIDLSTGTLEASYSWDDGTLIALGPRDSENSFWLTAYQGAGWHIVKFDGESFTVFAEGSYQECQYQSLRLAADATLWCGQQDADGTVAGIARFRQGEKRFFTEEDGLLPGTCTLPVIDYEGKVWAVSRLGISRISDGGWPPMRLMLHEVEREGTIAVEAQVINNGPVVGVDVYLALELNGQLLYWPNWQPEPFANQINLRPGHNQTETILEARREDIPPGSYTFWGCMTGRNTSKLIGPIDRKFETITIEVTDAR